MRFKLDWSKNSDKIERKIKMKMKINIKVEKVWKKERENLYRGTYNIKWELEKNLNFNKKNKKRVRETK